MELKAHGRVSRAVIGVVQAYSRDLAASLAEPPSGALINSVQPGGPAHKAGQPATSCCKWAANR